MSDPQMIVTFDDREIVLTVPIGKRRAAWSDVTRVSILISDAGPIVSDVYWAFHLPEGPPFFVPDAATGAPELLAEMQRRLPGFRNDQVIAAMQCVESAEFVAWERPGG